MSFLETHRRDVAICAALGLATAVWVCVLQHLLAFTNTNLDIWFDSDSLFILDQMTDRWSKHNDTNSRHPIFALLAFPVTFVFLQLGLDPAQAALPVLVLGSSLFVMAMYCVLRLMDRPVGISLLFTGVLAASTPAFLFLGLYERLILGGFTVLLFLAALLAYQKRPGSVVWLTGAAVLALGVTITNFLVAVVALPLALGWRRGLQALVNAAAVVAALSVVAVVLFPYSSAFLNIRTYPYASTVFSGDEDRLSKTGDVPQKAVVFLMHALALPKPEIEQKPNGSPIRYLSVQKVGVAADNPPVWYATVALWIGLFAAGLGCAFKRMWESRLLTRDGMAAALKGQFRDVLPWVLVLNIVGQFALFMMFGAEIILFSPYYLPSMLLVAAMAWRPGASNRLATAAAALLLLLVVWSNSQAFAHALAAARSLIPG